VQSQVRFNRVPEKSPEKVSEALVQPGQVQQGSREGSSTWLGSTLQKVKRCGCWGCHRSNFLGRWKLWHGHDFLVPWWPSGMGQLRGIQRGVWNHTATRFLLNDDGEVDKAVVSKLPTATFERISKCFQHHNLRNQIYYSSPDNHGKFSLFFK